MINPTILNKQKFEEILEYREDCLCFVVGKVVDRDFVPKLLFAIQKPNLDEALGLDTPHIDWTMHYDFYTVTLADSLEARQKWFIDEIQRIRKLV